MKNSIKTILLAFALLTTTKANATNPVLCGGATVNTFDVAGDWDYTWQDRSNPAAFLHGKLHLVTCNGFVTGNLGLPVEITDPFQIATWNQPVLGTENNLSVMLMSVVPGGTAWFFELKQNIALGSMAGETFAGTDHTDRNVIFTAKNFSGFGHRVLVRGLPTPCPSSAIPLPDVSGNYHYQWGTGWSGTMVINQSGPWLWGSIGLPVELADTWWATNWSWPFSGGMILPDSTIRIVSSGGNGFGDPWLYRLPLVSTSPYTFSGTLRSGGGAYATTCLIRDSDMTITHQ